MRKITSILLFTFFGFTSLAEEGMLIPSLLNAFESDMQAMGMKISAKDIYDANHSSIKDAIIHFGGGCTSSIVSDKGLLLTNHHCGYSQIYAHTTVENNIAKNGFWAKNFSEELPNNGLTATRMIAITDVTAQVFEGIGDLDEEEANKRIALNIVRIKAEAVNGNHYEADVKPFDYGNSYFLLVKETFKDVRLVGTPPRSVGKFGGDTDNWVWPRHTGDFAMFRIYVDQNNSPSEYNESNVPYSPIKYLPVSIKPREQDDFTLVFGFPGITYQHTISTELDFIIHKLRPAQIKMRDLSLEVINSAMKKSEITEINYAPKQSRISNAWKKWIGQIDGLKRGNALEQKINEENEYIETANSKSFWNNKYGEVVKSLRDLATRNSPIDFAYNMFIEYIYYGPEIFNRARKIEELLMLYQKGKDSPEFLEALKKEKESLGSFYDKYDVNIDKNVFLSLSQYYKSILEDHYLPELLRKNDVEKLQADIYKKSFLVDQKKYEKTINSFQKYAANKIENDQGFKLYQQLRNSFQQEVYQDLVNYYQKREGLMKTYLAGSLKMFPDKKHWSDANSTLRVSYGKLEGTKPRDGIEYNHHTTLAGVIEKYNSGGEDFELLPRMLELYNNKNYGNYAQDGELWVCFLSSNHTTGGNSGSPVINGEGELVGLNFDRTWESTMSDYMFDSSRCRNISVDIRYVLWLIDIYGEAPHIVKEMSIIQ